ncbi:hypothetical protein AU476_20850 [Cupriavidus sp. UYMSc13B]|nr:hypothetical protein AU476_20850 [Cupriavidus sp. UYMSc13B]
MVEDARRQDIAADHAQVGGGIFRRGLFHDAGHLDDALVPFASVDYAIGAALLRRDLFHAQHGAVVVVVDVDHLLHHRRIAVDQVVGQHDGKRRVAHQLGCAQHRVAQAQCFGLAHVEALDVGRLDRTDRVQQRLLVLGLELHFQFVGLVEMVLDGALGAAGDKDHLGNAGGHGFFHGVLDQWLVDDRQHFLRARFGGGEEAGAQSRDGEDGLVTRLSISCVPSECLVVQSASTTRHQ